jgi:hypothetical protein
MLGKFLQNTALPHKGKSTKYTYSKAKKQDVVLTEVHIFTGDTFRATDISTPYTISLADVQKIERIDYDNQKTTSTTYGEL